MIDDADCGDEYKRLDGKCPACGAQLTIEHHECGYWGDGECLRGKLDCPSCGNNYNRDYFYRWSID